MTAYGELISQFVITLDDEGTITLRGLMIKLEDKIKETGFKRHGFTDAEIDLIHEIAEMFERE